MNYNLFEATSKLEKLLTERLAELHGQWETNRREREKLDLEGEQISSDIRDIDAALAVENRRSGRPLENPEVNGSRQLIGLGLRDAVAMLRRGRPGVSKGEIKEILESVHFDFKEKRPGNAINMAWISLDRKK